MALLGSRKILLFHALIRRHTDQHDTSHFKHDLITALQLNWPSTQVYVCLQCSVQLKTFGELGAVAHAYNSSYLEGRDWEDRGSRPAWGKRFMRPHLNQQLGMAVGAHHPNYNSINRRTVIQASLGHKRAPVFKITNAKSAVEWPKW
jgi:hypothetical protein